MHVEQPSSSLAQVERELQEFEQQQRKRLGIAQSVQHWQDPNPQHFGKTDRDNTTILVGGLTMMQDRFLEAGLSSLGYRIQALDCPDNNSLQLGKEFGNRGQCNPTYFTVGNLVKYLIHLRDEQGLSRQHIIEQFIFVTAGACGPCRFGTYVTEYRKALRDAGFDGFRIFLFKTTGGINQSDPDQGLAFTPTFFMRMFKCIILGDIVNLIGYRIRPYEVTPGSTDKALEQCRDIICETLRCNKIMWPALRRCRRLLRAVPVDRLQVKAKVTIIGEFWAMTTEGEGNYRLQRFLENEGAECEIQPVTNWLLYVLWQTRWDTRWQMDAHRRPDDNNRAQINLKPRKTLILCRLTESIVRTVFTIYARAIGLKRYHLASMDELAKLAREYYQNELRGGEGHMEVGKLIQCAKKNKSHLVLSIKPFGCMPSSGVSDGVQSLIMAKYPNANFIPIETSGDSAVNAYSRIQMALFKARQQAEAEFKKSCEQKGGLNAAKKRLGSKYRNALHYPKQRAAGTASNLVL